MTREFLRFLVPGEYYSPEVYWFNQGQASLERSLRATKLLDSEEQSYAGTFQASFLLDEKVVSPIFLSAVSVYPGVSGQNQCDAKTLGAI